MVDLSFDFTGMRYQASDFTGRRHGTSRGPVLSKNSVSGDLLSKKPKGKVAVSSAAPMKPSAAPTKPSAASMKPSAAVMKPIGQSGVSSAKDGSADSSSKKRKGKDVVCSDVPSDKNDGVVNALSKTLIDLGMLLIDEEGTVIQGFIQPSSIDTYLRHMIPGSTYRLNNFFGSKTKKVYRVADPDVTIAFSWNSVLSVLKESSIRFPEDRFRFHGYEQFKAACDLRGDLYVEIASGWQILVHVKTHDGHMMKLNIWDKTATAFWEKFKSLGKPPSALSLSSLSSSRVFFDMDVHPTREYLAWLKSNSEVAYRVNAEIVTKAETATIGELLTYMKQEEAKVAWFECTATIDDVVRGSAWYYISCGGCKTKATKGPTTLMCKKCRKTEITGAADDVGCELTGKKASELVESYYEANEGAGDDHVVPVPQALIDTIGQERTFIIKISNHNLEGKTQSLTVTKVLPLEVPALGCDLDANVVVPPTAVALGIGNRGEGSSIVNEEHADEGVKRGADMIVSEDAKRAKSG
uniref:Replication factor A C-terminal domain-containing protein n=1 Tax=Brassica oleracea var. oleracea TaxID=109376 RepID=A0A0D3BFL1_BRAOL